MKQESNVLQLQQCRKYREQGGTGFELIVENLVFRAGQFIAVVGDSGCGKSTLLDLLALVSKPTECHTFNYHFDAHCYSIQNLWQATNEVALADIRRQYLGYVLQTGGLLPFLTVRQNIELPCKINALENYSERLLTAAKRMKIDNLLAKKPQYLSGGQRQRVAILRALAHRPKLIFADEPTAAVDRDRAHKIVMEFMQLAAEYQTTIVMVTHDRELIKPLTKHYITFQVEDISESLVRSTCHQNE